MTSVARTQAEVKTAFQDAAITQKKPRKIRLGVFANPRGYIAQEHMNNWRVQELWT